MLGLRIICRVTEMKLTMIAWVVLLIASIGCGASIVAVLVVRKRLEVVSAAAGGLLMLTALLCSGYISSSLQRTDVVFYTMAFIVAGVGGGYALVASLLLRIGSRPRAPRLDITDSGPTRTDHVIIATCVDGRTYDPFDTASVLAELMDDGLLEVSLGVIPLLFFAQKARYRAAGDHNPAYEQLSALTRRLQQSLGDAYRVSWATCSGENTLVEQVAQAHDSGAARIVVARLDVADSPAMVHAMREVDALSARTDGLSVYFTETLVTSQRLIAMMVERVTTLTEDPDHTGVVLAGHGQSEERARTFPAYDEDEVVFLNRIRAQLVDRGFAASNVRVAWNEWREPDITESVRHLAALDCRRVIVVPAVWPLDTIATRLDIELAAREAHVGDGARVMTVGAWGDDERVAEELRVRVLEAIDSAADDTGR